MVELTYITHLFQLILLNWNTIRFQEFTSSECIYQEIGADLSTTQYQRKGDFSTTILFSALKIHNKANVVAYNVRGCRF